MRDFHVALEPFAGVEHLRAELTNESGEPVHVLRDNVRDHVQLLHRLVLGAEAGHADEQIEIQRYPRLDLNVPPAGLAVVVFT